MGVPDLERWHGLSFPEPNGYILDETFTPVAVPVKYAMRCRHMTERVYRVGATEWKDGTRVSTVLLSVDHWFEPHRDNPTFETMIFPGDRWEDYQTRRRTVASALRAHRFAVGMVLARLQAQPIRDDQIVLP